MPPDLRHPGSIPGSTAPPPDRPPLMRDRSDNGNRLIQAVLEQVHAHPLALLLLFAAALRIVAALTPGFHHPDAIYQYLEPAHRLLTGDGLTTWEWRVGMRSWLLPTLLAGPMALGRWLGSTQDLALALPRIAVALASLGIVWAAFSIGLRVSRATGALAGFVAAGWFEFVHFGAQTLAEPVAVAAFLPAAALLMRDRAGRTALVAAGALLALAAMLRPHYAPAWLALLLVARWRDLPRSILPVVAGGLAMAAISATIDLMQGSTPFAWMVENLRQNVVEHRADRYGIAPPFAFIAWYMTMWSWWAVPLLIGVRIGFRHAPALVVAAIVNLVLHSLIGHKEYRFVFLTTAALVVVSAIGWGEMLRLVANRWPQPRLQLATVTVWAAWAAASLLLASGPTMAGIRSEGRAGTILFADIRHDADACGVAVVEDATFADIPGTASLRRDQSLTIFAARDPGYGTGGMRGALADAQPLYDRVVTTGRMAPMLPRGYVSHRCEAWDGTRLCLFARPGQCRSSRGSGFAGNTALRRLNF